MRNKIIDRAKEHVGRLLEQQLDRIERIKTGEKAIDYLQIQPIIVGSPERALALSDALKARGIWIPAIRYPTVPKGEDRLRITLSATHTQQDIDVLVDAIALAMESIS